MQLIDKVSQLHKLTSVQVATAGAAIAVADQALPQLQAILPPGIYAVLFIGVVVARAVFQPKLALAK